MLDAGVFILFCHPVPDALAEISLVHSGPEDEFAPMQVGDVIRIGDSAATITEIGAIANGNFEQLGHIVVYMNLTKGKLLPGAVRAEGELAAPVAGDVVTITREEA